MTTKQAIFHLAAAFKRLPLRMLFNLEWHRRKKTPIYCGERAELYGTPNGG